MIAKAEAKYLRVSPRKVRRVIDLLREKSALNAQAVLANLNVGAGSYLKKILASALANAKTKGFNPDQLYISKIICDSGSTWKRYRASAFGRATIIRKRTAHIKLELDVK